MRRWSFKTGRERLRETDRESEERLGEIEEKKKRGGGVARERERGGGGGGETDRRYEKKNSKPGLNYLVSDRWKFQTEPGVIKLEQTSAACSGSGSATWACLMETTATRVNGHVGQNLKCVFS